MKRAIFSLFLSAVFLLAPPALTAAAAVEEGLLDEVRGEVTIIGLDDQPRPAREGEFVLSGELIETGADGFARLIMERGSAVEIRENSKVEVLDSRANESGFGAIALYLGRIWASIVKNPESETAFEVETPTATAGVRGTEFEIAVGADGATRVGVEKGVVAVESDQGAVELESGAETTVEWNRPPARPRNYRKNEEEWRSWLAARQDALIKNADKIVPWVVADVKRTRTKLFALKKAGEKGFKEFQAYAKRQRLMGRAVYLRPQQRKALRKYFFAVNRTMRELQRADRRMMARYFVFMRIYRETREHPELYSPEFIRAVAETKKELDRLDIPKLHRQNKQIIDNYVTAMEEFASKKHAAKALGRRIPPARKEQLLRARREYRERHPY